MRRGAITSSQLSAGSGGGGAYVADAVHLDGATYLSTSSLTATDSDSSSLSFWINPDADCDGYLFVVDPEGNYTQLVDVDVDGPTVTVSIAVVGLPSFDTLQIDATMSLGWHHILWSVKTNATNPAEPPWKMYVDDVAVGAVSFLEALPFDSNWNGLPLFVGTDMAGGVYKGDIADLRIMPNVYLLDGADDIPLATRRLFIDGSGKPVDPATATATLSAAGAVLFSGDATGFVTNQGTGGAFSLTGSLTNATTSPSD